MGIAGPTTGLSDRMVLHVRECIVGLLISLGAGVVGGSQKSSTPPVPKAGVCLREAAKLVGSQPVQIGKVVRAPKKIKNVPPDWPELPRSTSVGGVWVGEVLIDDKGRVAEVWPTRPFRLHPPFPAFNDAVVTAIRRWIFEPLLLDNKAVPFCMTVTVNINLQ
jgi:outer membrane biosynthesis protein TonB